ncbi:MAG: hypothetical protein Q7T37_00595 [bacterium]|nr:hypothetical protein [bacterium]MDO8741914.1 hypothetical protein [bacterium]
MNQSVDNTSSLQENPSVSFEGISALYRVRHTSGYPRFIYGMYSILGIIFYGIGIYTALGIVMRSLNGGAILSLETVLFLCYVLLNGIIGYGFMFCRKWLLAAFSSTLIFMGIMATLFFIGGAISRVAALLTSVFMIAGVLLFLFLTRRHLSGRYLEPQTVIPFMGALLVSFLLTNLGMLH